MNMDELRPKHILYLIDELKVKGGTEKHLYELAIGMADAGFRVTVFSLADGIYADEFKGDQRIHYACLNVTRIYDRKGLSAIAEIAGYMRSQQVDIIQSFHTASDLIAPLAARLSMRRSKVYSSRRDLGYTKSPRHTSMQRRVNCLVDGLLANSLAVKQAVQEQEGFPAERITVIHNGIDITPFARNEATRQRQRQSMGATSDSILVGSVGNIRPVKGYDLLVEAAGIVCRQAPNVRFCHAGEGDLRDQLMERCRELGIENQFSFLGTVKDIPSFLSSLDIYVQPSRSEGLSNAILEAMAAGLPVVATDVGGNPDLIDDGLNGLLVSLNINSIAKGLLDFVEQQEFRDKCAKYAYERVDRRHQLACMLVQYSNYYSSKNMDCWKL